MVGDTHLHRRKLQDGQQRRYIRVAVTQRLLQQCYRLALRHQEWRNAGLAVDDRRVAMLACVIVCGEGNDGIQQRLAFVVDSSLEQDLLYYPTMAVS